MPVIINNRYYGGMCAISPGTLLRNPGSGDNRNETDCGSYSGGKGIVMASQSRSTAEEEKSV